MNRIFGAVVIMMTVCLYGSGIVYGASFGDMFGGNKAREYKVMIEEKEQACQERLQEKDRQYQDMLNQTKESRETVDGMRDKNATLMQAYEQMKGEYDNTLEQLKRLRLDSQQCKNRQGTFDKVTEENEVFVSEKKSLKEKAEQLTVTVENLKLHLKEVAAEKDQLAVFLAEAQEDEDVKIKKIRDSVKGEVVNLEKQVALLGQENTMIARTLEKTEKELRISKLDNSGLSQKLELLQDELAASEEQYDALKKENKYLAQEATHFPKKFADLARHNRKLVKETADMHYNLGVANIKSKEYGRAIKEFEKVLELKPQDAYANYNLGYIYAEQVVDREKAIKYFQSYLAYASDARDANWVRKYILTWQTWYGKNRKN